VRWACENLKKKRIWKRGNYEDFQSGRPGAVRGSDEVKVLRIDETLLKKLNQIDHERGMRWKGKRGRVL